MLNWELYAVFVLIVFAVLVVPGPTMALIVLNTARHGGWSGVWTSLGIAVGETILVIGAITILSTALAVLADYSDWMRWFGTLYILYLASLAWRSAPEPLSGTSPRTHHMSSCLQGLLVAVSNPKTILFYAALFPGFVDGRLPTMPQLLLLGASFVVFALAFDLTCVLAATLATARDHRVLETRSAKRLSALCLTGVAILISPLSAVFKV